MYYLMSGLTQMSDANFSGHCRWPYFSCRETLLLHYLELMAQNFVRA